MTQLNEYAILLKQKNLIENNCTKQGRKSKLSAKKIQERYISTGIDHFISGEYPFNGCMLGYIIEGTPTRIVENINEILLQATRSDETLKKKKLDIPYLEEAYISVHLNNYVLHHYFLQFSKSQNNILKSPNSPVISWEMGVYMLVLILYQIP